MDRDSFWQLVESAKIDSQKYCPREHTNKLVKELSQLSLEELSCFETIRWQLLCQSYTCKLWDASIIITKDESDETFHGFRTGLMFQGENVFLRSIKLPDQVLADLWGVEKFKDCATLGYAAQVVYEKKTGCKESSIPLVEEEISFPTGEPSGCSLGHESELLKKSYPRLYKKYAEHYIR